MFKTTLRGIIAAVRRDIAGRRPETPTHLSTELAPSFAAERLRSLIGEIRPLAPAYADTPRADLLRLAPSKLSFTVLNSLQSSLPPRER